MLILSGVAYIPDEGDNEVNIKIALPYNKQDSGARAL